MSAIRCYLPPDDWTDDPLELGEAESKHVAGVLRAGAGDRIGLIDGVGGVGEAEIVQPHRKRTQIRILSRRTLDPFGPRRVLAQALIREQKMDWLIQKAVELGVHEIWPLQTDHAVVRIRPEAAAGKVERWKAVALSACKQSGNPWLPVFAPVRRLQDALVEMPAGPACFGALQEGASSLPSFFQRLWREQVSRVVVFIGPEGDFSGSEVEALRSAGVQPVTFGPIVFRVETAAIFALSALHYTWLQPEGDRA